MIKTMEELLRDLATWKGASKEDTAAVIESQTPWITDQLRTHTRLRVAESNSKRVATEPLHPDVYKCLDQKRIQHPHWFNDKDYPRRFWEARRKCEEGIPEPMGIYMSTTGDIELYWMTICAVADEEALSAKDLALKVLVHEWAHAFTCEGCDADGHCLTDTCFNRLKQDTAEGLAQYWTHCSLYRNGTDGAFDALVRLCKTQSLPYRYHGRWLQIDERQLYVDAGVEFDDEYNANSLPDRETIRCALISTSREFRYPHPGKEPDRHFHDALHGSILDDVMNVF